MVELQVLHGLERFDHQQGWLAYPRQLPVDLECAAVGKGTGLVVAG